MRDWWNSVETAAEKAGFYTRGNSDDDDWCFSIGSPQGQDCNIEVNAETPDEMRKRIDNFVDGYDVSYETYIWLDKTGHGTNGAPYDMKDVYEDMEWFLEKATELRDAIYDELAEYERSK